jgi:8-oxo-dGTP pyrophosphatase MutT (NUDIX family)
MGAGETPSVTGRSRATWPPAKPLAVSQVEQVAAVCYRARGASIEFLLVRTRKGRWTFPKGGAEAGLTHAQAAALEASEEAGVHGRIEEGSFTRYRRGKGVNRKESADAATVVQAYLCKVLRLGPPQELNRDRTWFSPEKTKWQLREGRSSENGADLARVVDCAVARIERLRARASVRADGLQKVQFEAGNAEIDRRRSGKEDSAAIEFAVNSYVREVLGLRSAQKIPLLTAGKMVRSPRVLDGSAAQNRKVVQINRPRKTRNS